jgi:predicted RNA-binding Zn ribbon-like protein
MLPTLSALPDLLAACSDCVTLTWRTTVVPPLEWKKAYAPAPTPAPASAAAVITAAILGELTFMTLSRACPDERGLRLCWESLNVLSQS